MKEIINQINNSNILKGIKKVKLVGNGGFSNCFVLTTNKGEYILKIRKDEKVERLKREYNLLSQKVLKKYNLAPKVYKFDNSKKLLKYPYLLEELVKGTHPDKKNPSREFIHSMAKWYSELHSIKSSRLERLEVKRLSSISFWVKERVEKSKNLKINSDITKKNFEKLKLILTQIANDNESILKRKIYNFVQCDPSRENIFIQKDGNPKLIDWDFAGYHIYERDLALFIETYKLNELQEKLFLKSYGVNPDEKFMKKLNILKLILCLMDITWLLSERKNKEKEINKILKKSFNLIKKLGYEDTKREN